MLVLIKKKLNNPGFSLLGVLIAFFIMTVGILGILSLYAYSISASSMNKTKLVAVNLAQEGIEIVRNIRDSASDADPLTNSDEEWLLWYQRWFPDGMTCDDTPFNPCVWYYELDYNKPNDCLDNPGSPSTDSNWDSYSFLKLGNNFRYNYSLGLDTLYKRKITITNHDSDKNLPEKIEVKSEVWWKVKDKEYTVTAVDELYNWWGWSF